MDRRGFLKFLGAATVGSTIAYSFPSIIVPKNIEKFPTIIHDYMLQDMPFEAYIRGQQVIFDMLDKDLQDALKIVSAQLNKEIYENPVSNELVRRFGVPDFEKFMQNNYEGIMPVVRSTNQI